MAESLEEFELDVSTTRQPAVFSLSNLIIDPAEIATGESVTISVVITNTGEEEGNYTARLMIDGIMEDMELVTLAAGANQTVNFTVSSDTSGSYEVDVGGQVAEFTVSQPLLTVRWSVMLIIAVVVFIGTIFFMMRRRKTLFRFR